MDIGDTGRPRVGYGIAVEVYSTVGEVPDVAVLELHADIVVTVEATTVLA